MDELKLPPRWLKCPRRGELVAGKFMPFKTPLDDKYKSLIPATDLFTPQMFIGSLKSHQIKLGLWIDLTFTSRFYDKKIVENASIKYIKYQCRGHGECPSKDQAYAFIELSDKYLSNNPTNVIGVHCTHGYNRTGFLICCYLIEKFGWSVDMALAEFGRSRPPGIYKQDYINELFVRYQDISDVIAAPAVPDWSLGYDDESVTEDGEVVNKNKNKRYNGTKVKVIEGVTGVEMLTDPNKVGQVQRKCQEMCGWQSSTFPGSQPVSMDRHNIGRLHRYQYKVSWKADGTRYMMLIEDKENHYLIDRDNYVYKITGLTFPKRKDPGGFLENTLLDGEMVIQTLESGDKSPRYLIYDIVRFDGINVGGNNFDIRLLCIQKEIILPRDIGKENRTIDRSAEPFSICRKEFWHIDQAEKLLSTEFEKQLCHEIDGLIFQPVSDPYCPGQCQAVLKWKPHTLNSVDFRLEIVREDRPGMLNTLVGKLMVGGNVNFGTIKVTKEIKKYDNKIIECCWDFQENKWKFLRERTDKSFPNSYNTAKAVWDSICQPVTKEGLIDYIHNFQWRPPTQKRPQDNDRMIMPPPKQPKTS